SFEKADEISGEAFANDLLIRKYACFGCPVGCIHIGLLREQFAPGHEYRYAGVSYDYELIYALGSLLGIGNRTEVLALIETVEKVGLDAMSTGVVLAWLTEARETGLVSDEALGTPLAFGEVRPYQEAVARLLVKGGSEIWDTARLGAAALAARYGGEFDLQLSGNEISGYHTGYATLLNHAAGARHSHLDSGGYALDQQKPTADPVDLVDPLIAEERERCVFTSLNACLFARKIYGDRALVREALASLGIERSDEELDDLGKRTLQLKHRLKRAMGFSLDDVRLPKRFFETPSLVGQLDQAKLERALDLYRQRLDELLSGGRIDPITM
ncbi:MAG: aldehyde ferredoxin oxidoreductase C-terminal domain-containing protein, partial [Chloroflexota bacterium]